MPFPYMRDPEAGGVLRPRAIFHLRSGLRVVVRYATAGGARQGVTCWAGSSLTRSFRVGWDRPSSLNDCPAHSPARRRQIERERGLR